MIYKGVEIDVLLSGWYSSFVNGKFYKTDTYEAMIEYIDKITNQDIYVCPECGSKKIEGQSWTDVNTGEVMGGIDTDDIWCRDCQENVGYFISEKEYNETKSI